MEYRENLAAAAGPLATANHTGRRFFFYTSKNTQDFIAQIFKNYFFIPHFSIESAAILVAQPTHFAVAGSFLKASFRCPFFV